MNMQIVVLVLLAALLVWNVVLSYLYYSSVKHYKQLKIEKGQSFQEIFEKIFSNLAQLHAKQNSVADLLSKLRAQTTKSVQNVGLKRFNPYDDAGGDQSFSMALMDEKGNGVVLSSLHGRTGTRIYAKPVENGKSVSHEFSTEENEVIGLLLKK